MAQSTQYQAVKQGGPFEIVTVARPAVQDGDDVLVKLKAVALQPLDWKMLYYGFMVPEWPAVFGLDGAGVVEEVGSSVKNFKPGDEVFGHFSPTHREFALAKEAKLAKKPDDWTIEEVSTLPVAYVSAVALTYTGLGIAIPFLVPYGGLKEGFQPKSLLVLGGSSSVGATVIQILRHVCPDAVIITTSSEKHHSHLKALGADVAFDRSASADAIRGSTPGSKGVDAIVDAVGGAISDPAVLEVFDPAGAKKLSELATGADVAKIPDGVNRTTIISSEVYGRPGGPGLFPALSELLASKKFALPITTKVVGTGYEAFSKGLDELKAGVSGTKLVVTL